MTAASAITGAIAEINLAALCANYRLLAEKVAPQACAAVVKANAYGLGVEPVARALYDEGCRHFFVATMAEGIQLRQFLADVPIGVFYGVTSQEDARAALEYALMPTLNSLEQVDLWCRAAKTCGETLPALLHVDTGMNRLGLSLTDARQLTEQPQRLEGIDLRWLMTHLACAGTPEHDLNRMQLARFREAAALFPHVPTSFANSSGIFLGREYHGQLARPGAALYGVNPIPHLPNQMRTVVTVKAPVLQIRTLSQRDTVGYNATCPLPKGARLATIACGYADGLIRAMGNRAKVFIAGQLVPLAGIVSMDLSVADISSLPENTVQTGDWIELIGPNAQADVAAEQAGTIAYELFTSLGMRMKREYVRAI